MEFIATGEVDINTLVPAEKLTVILKLLKEMPEATSGTLREKLGDSYSFGEIKAAIAFSRKEEVS